ncbi:MAG TPA: hypothetical protein VFA09_02655 [Ktedonobacteraceae bacterium]|jgi:hypothetical protein|nr:hypothetical protein [Ktedonobacteraceae bacterium]
MQKVSLRKINPPVYQVQTGDEEILHFSLEGLLPAEWTLALNVSLGTLSLIADDPGKPHPYMLAQQQFTSSELSVLMPLLKSYPHYCPYEVMLASFNHGHISDSTVERSRQKLYEAQLAGVWDQEMRPVRNVLSRTRLKMRSFGIEISSILETGYVLMVLSERKQREA